MAGKLTGISAIGLLAASVVWCVCSCGTGPVYSIGDHNNVAAYDLIVSLDYDTNAVAPSQANLTITSYKNGLADCFVDWGDHRYNDDGLVGNQAVHTYTENGQYAMWVFQKIDDNDYLYDYAEIRIGVRAEPYADPVKGDIEIFDRQAYVYFSNPEQYRELESGLADVPAIAAFLSAENLTAGLEWIYGARLIINMPEGMTIEQAAEEWPVKYPGLIDHLEPIPLDEAFSAHQSNPMEFIMY
jgi:hypothetical protein